MLNTPNANPYQAPLGQGEAPGNSRIPCFWLAMALAGNVLAAITGLMFFRYRRGSYLALAVENLMIGQWIVLWAILGIAAIFLWIRRRWHASVALPIVGLCFTVGPLFAVVKSMVFRWHDLSE